MKFISSIVTAASGSIRGCTFSRNRSGAYIRGRVIPVNPASSFQNNVRGYLSNLVARWTSTLTPTQREGWDTWALNTPQTDSLGQALTITGQNAYIKSNTLRMQASEPPIDDAPTLYAGTPLTPPYIVSADESTQDLVSAHTVTDEWALAAGGFLLIYQGRPQNPSVNFYKGPYRFLTAVQGAATPPTSPDTSTPAFPFSAGQMVPMAFRAISPDGRISPQLRASIIAVA